ncbi:MAG: 2-oxoglutarate dehydrogenase complex dihydrolipoyllysine-residue succinyltransferase [Alphaproteobacteria bacterium]
MTTPVVVPALGESITEATVAKWFKTVGEAVAINEAIAELETDKVTVEVFAPVAGVLSSCAFQTGDTVAIGATLGVIAEGAVASAAATPAPSPEPALSPTPPTPTVVPDLAAPVVPPAAAKIMAEHNLSPADVSGTGKKGQILKSDVVGHLSQPAQTPAASAPREERRRMTRLRARIAERLKEAQNTAAILTTFNEIDMSRVIDLRNRHKDLFEKKHGIKLGFMGFFVKAAIAALQDIPSVNAQIEGDEIIYKNHYDIGVAVGTDAGLVVPIVRDADALNLAGIEKTIAELAIKARSGKLSIDDMNGGTFTITNGGVYGSLLSTPILNTPQSGILGLHKVEPRPVVVKDQIVIRPMMYVALSYDHRIIDGKEAVTFLVHVKEMMEDPERMLLAV